MPVVEKFFESHSCQSCMRGDVFHLLLPSFVTNACRLFISNEFDSGSDFRPPKQKKSQAFVLPARIKVYENKEEKKLQCREETAKEFVQVIVFHFSQHE